MLKPLWKKRRILLIGAALSAVLFLAAFYLIFSTPVDLSSQHERIEAIIENRTGLKVRSQSIVLRAFPYIDLRLKDVAAFDGDEAFLKMRSLKLVLPLTSIFSNSLKINSLDIDGLELNVKKNAAGEINIAHLFKESARPVALGRLNLSNAAISFKDEAAGAAFNISGIKAAIRRTPKGFDYTAEAELQPGVKIGMRGTGNNKEGRLKFAGTCNVRGFDLARLTPYMKKKLPKASISGRADFNSSYSYNGEFKAKGRLTYKKVEAVLPGLLARPLVSADGIATMNFFRDTKGAALNIGIINLAFDGFSLSGSLKVKSTAAEDGGVKRPPVLEAKLSSTPVPVRALLPYVPASYGKIMEKFRPVDGTVTLDSLLISGTADDMKGIDVYKKPGFLSAALKFDNMTVKLHDLEGPATNIRGVLAYRDNILSLEHFTLKYRGIVVDGLSGRIQDPFQKADYNLSLSSTLEASEILPLARTLFKGRDAADDVKKLNMARLTGKAGLTLKLTGTGRSFKGAAFSGALKLHGVDAGYGDIPLTLKSLNGAVSFDNKKIKIKDVKGTDMFASEININGSAENYLSKEALFDIRATGALSQETLDQVIMKWGAQGPVYGGNLPFAVSLGGSPGSLKVKASLNFTPIAIEYKNFIKKAAGVQASARTSLDIAGKEISIHEFNLAFGKAEINAGGHITLDKTRAYSLFAESGRISPDDLGRLSALLTEGADSGGVIAFNVKAKKDISDKMPLFNGEVTIKEGRFNAAFLAKPIERLNASLKFNNDTIHFTLDSFNAGRTDIKGRLDVENAAVNFEVSAPGFYLEDLIKKADGQSAKAPDAAPAALPEKKQGRMKKFLSSVFETDAAAGAGQILTGSGAVKIEKGSLMGRTFDDFSAIFILEKDALHIKPLTFLKNEGRAAAAITIYREKANPVLFDAQMNFSGVQLEPFFTELGAKNKILAGPLRGEITLTGKRGASPFTAGLNGSVRLGSEDGRLHRFVLINKIFSIVNIFTITELFDDGLPYKYISGDFAVKDGIISTNNFKLDASSMRMSALGEINLPNSAIDAVLAMHPFVTIDKIVTTIPIAGWIIGGAQKSTFSMYYDITGPLKSPEVGPAPIKALGTGVIGILQRLIEAPVELLKPDNAPK